MTVISIVIPTFQEGDWLHRTLSFLVNQSVIQRCEIIFIDYDPENTGQTLNIVESFKDLVPLSHVVNVQHRGIGFARNMGVKESVSNIICNLDADSHYSDNNGILKMVSPILTGEAVMTIPFNSYDDGNPIVDTAVTVSNFIQYMSPFHLTGSCIRKDIIIASGGFADENTTDELGNITGYIQQNGLALKIINELSLIKSARRVKALISDPLNTYYKDFSIAYR